MAQRNVKVGAIKDVSGEVNVAGGDIYKGYTAEQVSVLLTQITSTLQPKPFDGRCPYKGLDVFEEEDADLFFGRERLVEDLVNRVKESRTVFITGPSGSGKSSLVRAGLIHALKQGSIKNLHSERWLYETMKPGREPIKDLALAFSRLKSPELANYFRAHANESNILNECAESVLSARKDQRFVLFVDQFEEVFTQISQEEERLAFLNMLAYAGAVENGRVIVLFAMRSDFVSNCATYPMINELLSQQFRQIGAMQPEELVSAIALPARHVGLPIEDELIARIINDMKGEPGALPLMQFALKDLFDSQQEKGGIIALTMEDYLHHGGIHKSLERHADNSFAKLSEGEQQLARSIFSGLIEIGRGTQDTRRTALFDELIPTNTNPEDVEATVQKLADARLIITDEQAGKDTVTISHEKLIDAWPWLKKLVNENRDVIALQNEIASDAKEWDDHTRDPSYLYTGVRLANAREQLQAKKLVLSGLAQSFIEAGVKAHSDELEAAQQRALQLRRRSVYLTAALVITLIAVGVAVFLGIQSRQRAKIALARQLAAQAQSINAIRNSKQMIAVLLATQSMKLFPTSEASQMLVNDNFAAHLMALMSHDGGVISVAFSPDGKYVVSGSIDDTVRVWEVATGNQIARMIHDDWVNSVAFSPDGKYVVSGSSDKTARVWEASTGPEVARMTHEAEVTSVAFSPDGKYVVSGSSDKTARVWEVSTGKEVARMLHDAEVTSVAFSLDGKYVVSGSFDNTARVWKASTGKEVSVMTHDWAVNSVAFSPDGKYVVSGSNGLRVWEASPGKENARMTQNLVMSVAFDMNGRYVASGGWDNTARVWEASTGQEVARMTHDDYVNSVAFSPDGKYVVSGSDDNTARVWETFTGQEVARMTHEAEVTSVAFSPDGKYVVSGSFDNTARVWKAATGQQIAQLTQDAYDTFFSPKTPTLDGKFALWVSDDHTIVHVWEGGTGKEVVRMAYDSAVSSVFSIALSADGKYVVSGGCDKQDTITYTCTQGSARVWEASTGKEVARMTHGDTVSSVAFSPDGKYVVSAGDGTARVWEASTGKEVARMTDIAVFSVTFSKDGKYVVSGSSDGAVRVWEAYTGKEVARMTHDSSVYSVTFSPDGKYVVSGSSDKTARLWEASTGKEVARITHDSEVDSVAFSPDSKYVVSASADHTAYVWEASTRQEITRIYDSYTPITFSPDGKYVSENGYFNSRAWLWRPDDLIADACSRIPRNLTSAEWKQYLGDESYQIVCPNLPSESKPIVIPNDYYTLIFVWPIILYIIYGWIAYLAITSNFNSGPTSDTMGFTWKRFAIAGSQGGLLVILSFAGLIIVYALIAVDIISAEFSPSPYVLLSIIPSGLWTGGAYSHFTRFQSGKLSRTKRTLLGSLSSFFGTFVFCSLIFTMLAMLFEGSSSISDWLRILLISAILGGISAVLSAFGALIYIFGIQKWMTRSVTRMQVSSNQ